MILFKKICNECFFLKLLKVIVPTVVYFFQSVTIQEIHTKKYKNTSFFNNKLTNTYTLAIFLQKIGFIWRNQIFVILHNNSLKHCFTSLDQEKWKWTISMINISFDIIFILLYSKPRIKKCDFYRHYVFNNKHFL